MLKAAIALMLIATVVSLFSGLFFLVKDEGHSNRLVTALTVRVVLAVMTLALITWGSSAASWFPTRPGKSLQHVDEEKQTDPHHIHKVPIPTGRLRAELVLGIEMPL